VLSCGRFYHRSCALLVKTTKLHKGRLQCPLHTCATCFAEADEDDVEGLRRQAIRGMTILVKFALGFLSIAVIFNLHCVQKKPPLMFE